MLEKADIIKGGRSKFALSAFKVAKKSGKLSRFITDCRKFNGRLKDFERTFRECMGIGEPSINLSGPLALMPISSNLSLKEKPRIGSRYVLVLKTKFKHSRDASMRLTNVSGGAGARRATQKGVI